MPQGKQPEPPSASTDAMTIHDLAKYLGVSWRTIQEWEGQKIAPPRMPLPGRVRRWSPAEVDQWLRDRRAAEAAASEGVACVEPTTVADVASSSISRNAVFQ